MVLLSIIIPCYNCGLFLRQSLDKLLRQDLDNCEVILINDGSEDDTLSIIQEYVNRYSNFVFVDQTNQGVSVARNNGIGKATGRYIYFLDSDDELSDFSLEYIKSRIIRHTDYDIFGFGYKVKINTAQIIDYCCTNYDSNLFSGKTALRLFLVGRLRLNICSLAISRKLIINKKIYFEQGHSIGEDVLFICKLLYATQSLKYFARHCFTYLIRANSVTGGGKFSGKNLETFEFLYSFFSKENNTIGLERPVNYFLMLRWGRAFVSYMKSSAKDEDINHKLIRYGSIRFKSNYVGNIKMWFVMKCAALLPLSLLFRIFKK